MAAKEDLTDLDAQPREALLARLRLLQSAHDRLLAAGAMEESARLECKLQTHQIELELQNRTLREAQAELEASRSRYADLYDFAPVAYLTLDDHECIRELNLAAAALLGFDRSYLVGKPFLAVARMTDPPAFHVHVRACLNQGRPAPTELTLTTPHRLEAFTVQMTSAAVRDVSGRAIACRIALADITALKQSKEAASQAHARERLLRTRMEALARVEALLNDRVIDLESSGLVRVLEAVVDCARALTGAQYAGLGLGDNDQQPFDPWVHSGLPPGAAAAIGQRLHPVGLFAAVAKRDQPLRLRDLRERPELGDLPPLLRNMTSFLGVPIRRRGSTIGILYLANKNGAESGEFTEKDEEVIAMFTPRVAATIEIAQLSEAALKERARLAAVLEQMPDAVLLVTPPRSQLANEAARTLAAGTSGVSGPAGIPAYFKLRDVNESVLPWDELPVTRALAHNQPVRDLDLQVERADGSVVPVLASATPIRDAMGQPTEVVLVLHDVSRLKKLEQLRDEWISVVVHDLLQPLQTITLSTNTVAFLVQEPKLEKPLHRIRAAAFHLSRMINDLLDAGRIELGHVSLRLDSREPLALVHEAIAACPDIKADRPIRLDAQPALPRCLVNPTRFTQILGNLLANANKYGQSGSEILVSLAAHPSGIEVAVTTIGPTLSAAELERIFERRYRTETARASEKQGLGLGLYIVRGLVEAHGGQVSAESLPGQRTVFRFTIPQAR